MHEMDCTHCSSKPGKDQAQTCPDVFEIKNPADAGFLLSTKRDFKKILLILQKPYIPYICVENVFLKN